MRSFLTVLAFLSISLFLPAFEIVRILPAYKTDRDFERISEYFTGKENESGSIMLRSRKENRNGYYLSVRVKTPVALPGTRIVLHMIQPDDGREVREYAFSVDLEKGSHLLNIGVTGEDWRVSPRRAPVAWKLVFLDSSGTPLASEQSYLWEKPPGQR